LCGTWITTFSFHLQSVLLRKVERLDLRSLERIRDEGEEDRGTSGMKRRLKEE
jgi:hypothetical protein